MPSGNHDQCSVFGGLLSQIECRNGNGLAGDVYDGAPVRSVTCGVTDVGGITAESGDVGGVADLGKELSLI